MKEKQMYEVTLTFDKKIRISPEQYENLTQILSSDHRPMFVKINDLFVQVKDIRVIEPKAVREYGSSLSDADVRKLTGQ